MKFGNVPLLIPTIEYLDFYSTDHENHEDILVCRKFLRWSCSRNITETSPSSIY